MKRRVLMIVLAVTLGLVGAGAIFSYLQNTDSRALAGKQPTKVLVAAKRIPAGTTVKSITDGGYVKSETIPASAKPADALDRLADASPTDVALGDVPSGGVVLDTMFGRRPPATSGLKIPDGMVAVSFSVSSEADVAGYVQPGAEVAVFDTFILLDAKGNQGGSKDGGGKTDNWATKLLLARVPVLAVSQAAPSSTKESTPSDKLLVTVAVNQHDAERMIHVARTGNITLALLSEGSVTAPDNGVDNHAKLSPVFDLPARTAAQ